MNVEEIKHIALEALEDLKGQDAITLDVRAMTDITDYMLVCTGTSNRHVKSLADNVALTLKKRGCQAINIEGVDKTAEWALVDFGEVIVHVMLPETRDFYDLESLWSTSPEDCSVEDPMVDSTYARQ